MAAQKPYKTLDDIYKEQLAAAGQQPATATPPPAAARPPADRSRTGGKPTLDELFAQADASGADSYSIGDSLNLLGQIGWNYLGGKQLAAGAKNVITEGGPPTIGYIAGTAAAGPIGGAVGAGTGYLLNKGLQAAERYLWPEQAEASFGPAPTPTEVLVGTIANTVFAGAFGVAERAAVQGTIGWLAKQAGTNVSEREIARHLLEAAHGLPSTGGMSANLTTPVKPPPPPVTSTVSRGAGQARREVQQLMGGEYETNPRAVREAAAAAATPQVEAETAERLQQARSWADHGRLAIAGATSESPASTEELTQNAISRWWVNLKAANAKVQQYFKPIDDAIANAPEEASITYRVKDKSQRSPIRIPTSYQAPFGGDSVAMEKEIDNYIQWYEASNGGKLPQQGIEPGNTVGAQLRYALRIARNDERLKADPILDKLEQIALPDPNKANANLSISLSTMMRDRSYLRTLQYKLAKSAGSREAYPILGDVINAIDAHIADTLDNFGIGSQWRTAIGEANKVHTLFDRSLPKQAFTAGSTKTGSQLAKGSPLQLESINRTMGPEQLADIRVRHYDESMAAAEYAASHDGNYGRAFRTAFVGSPGNVEKLDILYEGRDWQSMLNRIDPPKVGTSTAAQVLKATQAGTNAQAANKIYALVTDNDKAAAEILQFFPDVGSKVGPKFAEKHLTAGSTFDPTAWSRLSPEVQLAIANGRQDVADAIGEVFDRAGVELGATHGYAPAAISTSAFRRWLATAAEKAIPLTKRAMTGRSPYNTYGRIVYDLAAPIIGDLLSAAPRIAKLIMSTPASRYFVARTEYPGLEAKK